MTLSPQHDAIDPDDEAANTAVEQERAEVREFVKTLSGDDIRSGNWFEKLLTQALSTYTAKVDGQYFQDKYAGVPADGIVDQRIKMAARYAAIEGGLSAGAYTAAVVATLGTAGGASPATVPAAVATLMVDVVYVTRLQVRLAYDIAVLYRVPLDTTDPEDLWKLIRVAFTIKGGEFARSRGRHQGGAGADATAHQEIPLRVGPGRRQELSNHRPEASPEDRHQSWHTRCRRSARGRRQPLLHPRCRPACPRGVPQRGAHHRARREPYRPHAPPAAAALGRVAGHHVRQEDRRRRSPADAAPRATHPREARGRGRAARERCGIDPEDVWARVATEDDDLTDVIDAATLVAEVDGSINAREKSTVAELRDRVRAPDAGGLAEKRSRLPS